MLKLRLLGYGLLGGHNHLDVLVLLRQCLLIVLCHYEIIELTNNNSTIQLKIYKLLNRFFLI